MSKQWNGSQVMDNFVKLAADAGLISTNFQSKDKDFVGNPSKETPVDGHRRYEPTQEYGVTEETDIIEKAHPKKIQVADSLGEGGVVENLKEQQEKIIDIAVKMPSGALIGVHAGLVSSLVKLANILEDNGKVKEAKRVDETIEKLISLPFQNSHLYKKAWIALAMGIASLIATVAPTVMDWAKSSKGKTPGQRVFKSQKYMNDKGKVITKKFKPTSKWVRGAGLAGMALTLLSPLADKLTSLQEGIVIDSKDLIDKLKEFTTTENIQINGLAKKALALLQPSQTVFSTMDLSSTEGNQKFMQEIIRLNEILPQLENLILNITRVLDATFNIPFVIHRSQILEEKFNTFVDSLQSSQDIIKRMKQIGSEGEIGATIALNEEQKALQEMETIQKDNEIKAIQMILFQRGFPKGEVWEGEVTGVFNFETLLAAHELENKLDVYLDDFNNEHGLKGSWKNQIVNNETIKMNPKRLLNLLQMIEKIKI